MSVTILCLLLAASPEEGPLSLPAAIEAALAAHPSLVAIDAERRAAAERRAGADVLPRPMVGIGIRNLPTDPMMNDPMTMKELELRQSFPWPGAIARREAARDEAALHAARRDGAALALAEAVAIGLAELWYAEEEAKLASASAQLSGEVATFVAARGGATGARPSALVAAELERARAERTERAARDRAGAVRARLSGLLGREVRLAAAPPSRVTPAAPSEPLRVPELEEWAARATLSRARAGAAEASNWPTPELSVAWAQRDDLDDMVNAMLMLDLPAPWATGGGEREAEAARAEAAAAEAWGASRARELRAERAATLAELHASAEALRRTESEGLPRSEALVEALRAALPTGGVDVPTLLEAERGRLAEALTAAAALRDHAVALARLGRLSGEVARIAHPERLGVAP